MQYDSEARALILGRKDCGQCSHQSPRGTMPAKVPCAVCKGTGNGPKGGRRTCRACSGFGTVWNHENRVPCGVCGGAFTDAQDESFCDTAPDDVVRGLPITVERTERGNTLNENYLGMGCLFSVTDYGTASESSDAQVIASVREHLSHTQATKIVAPYERDAVVAQVCDSLTVTVTRNGYAVRPAFSQTEVSA